jgi:hypothetical protein
MMGRRTTDQAQFFYSFILEKRVPASHRLRKINPFVSYLIESKTSPSFCRHLSSRYGAFHCSRDSRRSCLRHCSE